MSLSHPRLKIHVHLSDISKFVDNWTRPRKDWFPKTHYTEKLVTFKNPTGEIDLFQKCRQNQETISEAFTRYGDSS